VLLVFWGPDDEFIPSVKVSRVAVFWDASSRLQFEELQRAARVLGVQLGPIELHDPYDFTAAFTAAKKMRAGAVMVLFSPAFIQQRTNIAKLAVGNKLPTICQDTVEVTAGCLVSYGPSSSELFQRTAYYIDRLLRGERAADLPVEQSSKFRLLVNLRTAKSLGITIPESILLRADEVIR